MSCQVKSGHCWCLWWHACVIHDKCQHWTFKDVLMDCSRSTVDNNTTTFQVEIHWDPWQARGGHCWACAVDCCQGAHSPQQCFTKLCCPPVSMETELERFLRSSLWQFSKVAPSGTSGRTVTWRKQNSAPSWVMSCNWISKCNLLLVVYLLLVTNWRSGKTSEE